MPSPLLSYPSDLNLLDFSWKSCSIDDFGIFDPPRTLDKAAEMVSVVPSSVSATPAAKITPVHAPATPTPDPKDPRVDNSDPSKSTIDSAAPIPASSPMLSVMPGGHQHPQPPTSPNPDPVKPNMVNPSSIETPNRSTSANHRLPMDMDPSNRDHSKTSSRKDGPSYTVSSSSSPAIDQLHNSAASPTNEISNQDLLNHDPSSATQLSSNISRNPSNKPSVEFSSGSRDLPNLSPSTNHITPTIAAPVQSLSQNHVQPPNSQIPEPVGEQCGDWRPGANSRYLGSVCKPIRLYPHLDSYAGISYPE